MLDLLDFLRDVNFGVHFVYVFVLMFLVDVAYTMYTVYASKGREVLASAWASAIILLSAFSIISYIQDHSLIIPAMLGAFCGTYFALRHMK